MTEGPPLTPEQQLAALNEQIALAEANLDGDQLGELEAQKMILEDQLNIPVELKSQSSQEKSGAEIFSEARAKIEEEFGNVPENVFIHMTRESPTEISVTLGDQAPYSLENKSPVKLYLPDSLVLKTEVGSVTTGSLGGLKGLLERKISYPEE